MNGCALSPEQQRLADLVAARDALAMGKSVASVTHNGKTVSYHAGDIGRLDQLIAEARTALGLSRRRSFVPSFGGRR
ncbi:MAG: hypothetical protein IPK59_10370 [Rhodospirillaceae bacterium]|nr:hypothetical protein [Rhodospirillaceae bacterium]